MKLIEIIRWENDKAVALVYADTAADLGNKLTQSGKTLEITKGSMGYLGNGNVYVFNGTTWSKVGA